MNKKQYRRLILTTFFLCSTLLTSCNLPNTPSESSSSTVTNPTQSLLPTATTLATERPTAIPSLTPTTTRQPLTIALAENLPEGIIQQENLPISENAESALWFGPQEEAKDGQVLTTATWVFALAAPFPTLIDEIRQEGLKSYWLGNTNAAMDTVNRLYVTPNVAEVLDKRWGVHSEDQVILTKALPEPEQIWEENAWLILPFDALVPKLKVIQLDGISPLTKDFNLDDYLLTMKYQLVFDNTSMLQISENEIQPFINAIQTSNHHPDKMTTLVMTGVTALVRATAYKMEMNGVLYPGEAIRDWLTGADLTHISNEVSFYEDCPYPNPNSRSLLFCSDPKYIELLEFVGTDIIELTGNHNNDVMFVYGENVVPYNLNLYQERGWVYYGGGFDLADATAPRIIEHNGNQLAFIGCNASGPDYAWATETQGGAANCGDYEWMADEITRLRAEGYLPIATLQYFEDYYNFPAEHHIRDFGILAEAGAVIVNGSQAHRPKGMAFSSDAFIDYGLGNLFFDQMGIIDAYGNQILQTRWEVIQRHTFYNGQHLSTELLTAMLEDYAQPRPMTFEERVIFLEELFAASGWNSR